MTVFKEFQIGGTQGGGRSPFGGIGGLLSVAVFVIVAYFIFKGLFSLLSFVAPVLFLATLIIDHNVVLDFGKFLFKLLKDNPLMGIIAIVLSVLAFPFTAGFLFFKAMMRRSVKKMQEAREENYSDYDEVTPDEDFSDYEEIETLDLPEIEIEKPKERDNDYDQIFE